MEKCYHFCYPGHPRSLTVPEFKGCKSEALKVVENDLLVLESFESVELDIISA